MKTENDIIDCDGTYEVHPSDNGWAVVNGLSGQVRSEHDDLDTAVDYATQLNADA